VTTRTYTPAEWLRRNRIFLDFTSGPPAPGAWMPAPGSAALVFRNAPAVREARIMCAHGQKVVPIGDWSDALAEFRALHSQCVVAWTRLEFWPAGAAVVAAHKVTASPTPEAQRALAEVRRRGEAVGAYIAAHPCATCVPGVAETAPIADPDQVVLALVHQPPCPSITKET